MPHASLFERWITITSIIKGEEVINDETDLDNVMVVYAFYRSVEEELI